MKYGRITGKVHWNIEELGEKYNELWDGITVVIVQWNMGELWGEYNEIREKLYGKSTMKYGGISGS